MDIIACPECQSELRAGYGLVECKQCLSRFFRSANGIRPIAARMSERKRSTQVLSPIPIGRHEMPERCGVCGSTAIIGTARIQGHKGFRMRRNICASCSTFSGWTEAIGGEMVQTVVVDTPTSRLLSPSLTTFRSRDEHQYNRETVRMVLPPYIGGRE